MSARGAVALRAAARWLAPGVAIAGIAAIAGALVEAVAHGVSAAVAAIGAGEGAAVIAPLAALAISFARAVWRGWRSAIAAPSSGPLVVAGLGYAALATAAVFGAGYLTAQLGARATKLGWLAAVIAGAGAAGAALCALALARPLVRGGAWLVRRAWPGATPRRALAACGIGLVIALVAAWVAARPLLVRYDLGLAAYGGGFAAGAGAAGLAIARWPAARGWLATGAIVAAAALWIAARALAAGDPTALLDAWSQLPVSGRAIEARLDIGELRGGVLAAIPAPAPRAAHHPDILLITVDALRADRLGRGLTPALDALAAGGAVFERAYAPSSVTRGSIPSIMTSLHPGRIRGRLIDYAIKLDPRHVVLAERLQRAGYQTRGFLCCAHHFGGAFDIGLDRGMERVVYDPSGEHLAHAAQTFFEDPALDGAPRFAWLHTYEPHLWAKLYPPALYGAAPAPRYDRTVEVVDRALAPLLAAVRARGRPTIVVVAADHGEGLGDHGVLQHAGVPYASQIHVPLVIAGAGIPARRVAAPVGLVGLGATLLDLAGFSPELPAEQDGASFAPLIAAAPRDGTGGAGDAGGAGGAGGVRGEGEAYAAVFQDRVIPFTAHSLVAGDYHLIEVAGRAPELYQLRADPGELVDLARREPAVLADLQRRLAAYRARGRTAPF